MLIAAGLLCLVSCGGSAHGRGNRAEAIVAQIHNPESKYVVVACHRGDWRNYPENSIPAIESVIRMGADIVEIDIHMTADSVLVLMHDNDVRRMTNFSKVFRDQPEKSAKIKNLTLEEIKMLSLKRAHGVAIDTMKVPTLREALLCTKDRICVNIDKGYDYYDAVLKLIPLDSYVESPAMLMATGEGEATPEIWATYEEIINKNNGETKISSIERFAFYERARNAYAVIATGETAIYANIILKKGVI